MGGNVRNRHIMRDAGHVADWASRSLCCEASQTCGIWRRILESLTHSDRWHMLCTSRIQNAKSHSRGARQFKTMQRGSVMNAESDYQEYLDEIREHVCSRCIERPLEGPPCAPLGKRCGIEVNLNRLVDAVHTVQSSSIDPYVPVFHAHVCEHCTSRPTSQCPCALDYLFLLAVEAIEAVDERRHLAGSPTRSAIAQ